MKRVPGRSLVVILLLVASWSFCNMIAAAQSGSEPIAKDATVFGFKLHYLEAGKGAPVILLHGLGGDGSRWGPNIKPLSADFRVIALDQIGFGQSDKPLANYHTGMLAEFLAGFLKTVGIPKASLVGNSMGAGTALYTAVHYPNLVDRIVLADGGGFRSASSAPRSGNAPADTHRQQIQNSVTLDETREFFRILFHDKSLVTDKMVEEQFALRLRSAFAITKMQESGAKGLGSLSEDEVRAMKAPTLIIWGKYDELANPAGAERLHAVISGSQKVIIDNAGHMPQIERAAEFNKTVRDFLKGPVVSSQSGGGGVQE